MASERSTTSGTGVPRAEPGTPFVAWQALPYLVFVLLYALSFKRWVIPFQDSGRDLHIPARLASGEALYRDVGSYFGPLPPYIDALALRVFGHDLDVLIALRTLLALLAIEALRRLASRLAPDARVGACAAAFAVAACAFGLGGAWPFPYSVAALEGSVALWWALELALSAKDRRRVLAAAVLGGLGAGAKIEMLPAALVALGFAFFSRRPRGEAAFATAIVGALGAAAFGVPVALLGRSVLESHGFLIAFHTPPAWRDLYERMVLFGGNTPLAMKAGAWRDVLLPSAPCLAIAVAFSWVPRASPALLGAFGAVLGAASVFVPRNEELHALLPLSIGVAALEAWRWLRGRWAGRVEDASTARVAICLLMLPAVARMPLFFRNQIYGAFAAPLALLVSMGWFARVAGSRSFAAGLAAGLALGQGYDRVVEYGNRPWTRVNLPGARLFLPPEEARLVVQAGAAILRLSRPGGYVAVFPEPGLLLFSTDRRSPFIDEQFDPQCQDARGEDEMIDALRTRPPEVVLVTNRHFSEFGPYVFGDGILNRFAIALGGLYVEAGRIGGPQREPTRERRATEAVIWVPTVRAGTRNP